MGTVNSEGLWRLAVGIGVCGIAIALGKAALMAWSGVRFEAGGASDIRFSGGQNIWFETAGRFLFVAIAVLVALGTAAAARRFGSVVLRLAALVPAVLAGFQIHVISRSMQAPDDVSPFISGLSLGLDYCLSFVIAAVSAAIVMPAAEPDEKHARRADLPGGAAIVSCLLVAAAGIAAMQYGWVDGFARGEALREMSRGGEYFFRNGTVVDDFRAVGSQYLALLAVFGIASAARMTFDKGVGRAVSLGAAAVALVPLGIVCRYKYLAVGRTDSARFDVFRDTIPLDAAIFGVVAAVMTIGLMFGSSGPKAENGLNG